MRLTQLRSFHAVATQGSFTRAAEFLCISQPTITSQVRLLEEAYNVELFVRKARGVSLTPVGQRLIRISQQMFCLESDATHLLRDAGQLKTGELRVASVGPHHVSRALVEFKKRYPGIRVSATTGNSEDVIERLLDYRADIGVLARNPLDERLHAIPFGSYPIVVFVHADHPFARRRSIRIADLAQERLILREPGSTTRKKLEDALAAAGVHAEVVMEVGSRELIRECVLEGLGIAAVSLIEYAAHPRLRMLTISDADIHIDAHVLCLRERIESRMVQAFIATLPQSPGGAAGGKRRRTAKGIP